MLNGKRRCEMKNIKKKTKKKKYDKRISDDDMAYCR